MLLQSPRALTVAVGNLSPIRPAPASLLFPPGSAGSTCRTNPHPTAETGGKEPEFGMSPETRAERPETGPGPEGRVRINLWSST